MKLSIGLGVLVLSSLSAHRPDPVVGPQEEAGPPPVRVLVLGTWHMDNPGLDVVNMQAADVLTEAKQKELAEVTEKLAAIQPTKVMLERQVEASDLLIAEFREFEEAQLLERRDERVQIGYRLAHRMGHKDVLGIDRSGDFPFEGVMAYAQETGRMESLQAQIEETKEIVAWMERRQNEVSVAEMLKECNDPEFLLKSHGFYMSLLRYGGGEAQPGARVLIQWYERNAQTFARLVQATQPGDTVVVVYGMGHAYLLSQMVRETPGYELIEVGDVL